MFQFSFNSASLFGFNRVDVGLYERWKIKFLRESWILAGMQICSDTEIASMDWFLMRGRKEKKKLKACSFFFFFYSKFRFRNIELGENWIFARIDSFIYKKLDTNLCPRNWIIMFKEKFFKIREQTFFMIKNIGNIFLKSFMIFREIYTLLRSNLFYSRIVIFNTWKWKHEISILWKKLIKIYFYY